MQKKYKKPVPCKWKGSEGFQPAFQFCSMYTSRWIVVSASNWELKFPIRLAAAFGTRLLSMWASAQVLISQEILKGFGLFYVWTRSKQLWNNADITYVNTQMSWNNFPPLFWFLLRKSFFFTFLFFLELASTDCSLLLKTERNRVLCFLLFCSCD